MECEFVECIKQAKLENNMALVSKSNGMKRKSEETETELKYSREKVIRIERKEEEIELTLEC